jgi:hypothetical protein
VTVLARREDEFVIDKPFRIAVEECRRWVNVYWCSLDQGLVALLGILLGSIAEETRTNGPTHPVIISACREDIVFVSRRFSTRF